jgi:hypothetical protein
MISETKKFFAKFTQWLKHKNGYQEMCEWLRSVNIRGTDFRLAPMTPEKEALTEIQTSADGNIEKASIEIIGRYEDFSFSLVDVQNYWKLSQPSAKVALANAGFVSCKRRWVKGQKNPSHRYIHKNIDPSERVSLFDGNTARHETFISSDADEPETEITLKTEQEPAVAGIVNTAGATF